MSNFGRKYYCTVRFDDICPTMNWKQFEKAIDLMKKYDIKPLLGVIPDNRDPDQIIDNPDTGFWKRMRYLQDNGYTIALHGYQHVYDKKKRGMVNRGNDSEYAGHSYEIQYQKIHRGNQILIEHGIYTDIFFAPAHSYDKNTLKALKANGFRYLSDGKSPRPYIQCGIKCIPCRFFGTPKVKHPGIYISVCHTNKWNEVPENYKRLKYFLEQNKNNLVNYSDLMDIEAALFIQQKACEKLYILFYDIIRAKLASNKKLSLLYHRFCGEKI
jgi:Predicted deacetylase